MRMWLLDVYNQVKESFTSGDEVDFTYSDSTGFTALPIPQEYQLILSDFMNGAENQAQQRVDREKSNGVHSRRSLAYATVPQEMVFHMTTSPLTRTLLEALEHGIPVVIIGGHYTPHPHIGSDNYAWLCDMDPMIRVIEGAPRVGRASVTIADSHRAIKDLAQNFQKDLAWAVSFQAETQKGNGRFLSRQPKNPTQPKKIHPLFQNAKGQTVAFTLTIGNSELVVLPNVSDVHSRAAYITYILEEFLPKYRPQWFPDRWAGCYLPPTIQEAWAHLQTERERLLQSLQRREEALAEYETLVREHLALVTGADDELVHAVRGAFQDVLSVPVQDLDVIRKKQDKRLLFDLLGNWCGEWVSIECKGGRRGLKAEMLAQVDENVSTYLAEAGDHHIDIKLLVINAQCDRSPEQRVPFAAHLVREAEERRIGLLTTPVLIDLMVLVKAGKLATEQLSELLHKPGMIGVPTELDSSLLDDSTTRLDW